MALQNVGKGDATKNPFFSLDRKAWNYFSNAKKSVKTPPSDDLVRSRCYSNSIAFLELRWITWAGVSTRGEVGERAGRESEEQREEEMKKIVDASFYFRVDATSFAEFIGGNLLASVFSLALLRHLLALVTASVKSHCSCACLLINRFDFRSTSADDSIKAGCLVYRVSYSIPH